MQKLLCPWKNIRQKALSIANCTTVKSESPWLKYTTQCIGLNKKYCPAQIYIVNSSNSLIETYCVSAILFSLLCLGIVLSIDGIFSEVEFALKPKERRIAFIFRVDFFNSCGNRERLTGKPKCVYSYKQFFPFSHIYKKHGKGENVPKRLEKMLDGNAKTSKDVSE